MSASTKTTIPRRRFGRPSKFTRETRARILRCVEKGMPLSHAATASGVTHMSLITWRNKNPKFNDAVAEAISRGIEKRLDVIERAIDSPDESIRLRAAQWYLERTQPQHFCRSRVELTGADGQQFMAGVTLYLPTKEPAVIESTTEAVPALLEGGEK